MLENPEMYRDALIWVHKHYEYPVFWYLLAFIVAVVMTFGAKAIVQEIQKHRLNHYRNSDPELD